MTRVKVFDITDEIELEINDFIRFSFANLISITHIDHRLLVLYEVKKVKGMD